MAATRQYRRMSELLDVTGNSDIGTSPVSDGAATFPLTQITTQTNLDAILASVAEVDWIYMDPLNGFKNYVDTYGGDWVSLRYRHTLNNIVHVEGVLTAPEDTIGNPVVICVFPPECRSGYSQIFAPRVYTGSARVDLHPDGSLEVTPGDASGWLSLCGLSWSVEGTSPVLAAALEAVR